MLLHKHKPFLALFSILNNRNFNRQNFPTLVFLFKSELMAAANHRQLPKSEEFINRDIATTSYSPPSSSTSNSVRKKWSNVLPILMALVVIGEIAFLGRLDAVKNSDLVNSWADSFYHFTKTSSFSSWSIEDAAGSDSVPGEDQDRVSEPVGSCEAWLEKEDFVPRSRDFNKDPILVHGSTADWETCDVGCKYRLDGDKHYDATFGIPHQPAIAGVLRSMESSKYYPENSISIARGKGYDIVMTTSLSSDVPVGYFSWVEYDIMAPVEPKTEASPAAAFISNCGAKNFRLQALIGLENAQVKIDSYGGCHRNRDGRVDKVKTLKRYKFSLAFENSNEEDYVTEKYFQSLVAGSVPVVIGADNIQDFAPSHGSVLHIKNVEDVENIAKTIKYLAENSSAYNETLRWKYEEPSDSFKALFDMASVHSSCRLCIFLATKMQENDEKSPEFQKRPCKCKNGSKTTYHIYVRERGKFEMESVFLRSDGLTLEALSSAVLEKFKSLKYVPVWKPERPKSIRGGSELKVYRIYPVGMTQREALYTFRFKGDSDFRNYIERHPCTKFEVIFV